MPADKFFHPESFCLLASFKELILPSAGRPLSLSVDSISDLVQALCFRVKTLMSWPGCWLGVGRAPTSHASSYIIIIDAGLRRRYFGSSGSMIERVVPTTPSAYSIPNFAGYILKIGTKQCDASPGERPLGNSLPLRSFLFVPLRPSYVQSDQAGV